MISSNHLTLAPVLVFRHKVWINANILRVNWFHMWPVQTLSNQVSISVLSHQTLTNLLNVWSCDCAVIAWTILSKCLARIAYVLDGLGSVSSRMILCRLSSSAISIWAFITF